jgi:RecB family exonuclease
MTKMKLSASKISTFYQCQMQYHAKYDLKIRDDNPHPLTLMGSSVHGLLEISARALASGKREYLWNPFEYKDTMYDRFKCPKDLRPLGDELTQSAIDWGYFKKLRKDTKCELGFNLDLGEGVSVRGKIDRLDVVGKKADIIDLKTQKNKYSDSELESNWQARIYNLAVREAYPEVEEVRVSFWVLRHQVQRVWKTAEDAQEDKKELIRIAKDIVDCEKPIASVTALCDFCCYKDKCEKFTSRKKHGIRKSFKFFNTKDK